MASTRPGTTAGQHSFARIPSVEMQRSAFDRSSGYKTTFDSGYLIPFFIDEALPGDTMNLRVSTYARFATLLHPIIDNVYMDTHFFAIPMRLLWDNWQKFCGEQEDPGDSVDFVIPQIALGGAGQGEGTLSDYFGIPTNVGDISFSALWHRSYNLVWNEFFRDENLQVSAQFTKGDGPDSVGLYPLRRRGKRHDYFTSCLPFVQKGPAVELPLGTSAPLVFPTKDYLAESDGSGIPLFDVGGITSTPLRTQGDGTNTARWNANSNIADDAVWDDPRLHTDMQQHTDAYADLSAATAATINEIREAFQIQRLFERDARGGSRYTEIIRSHFQVVSDDARLQRPEYLGGGSTPMSVTVVPQQSQTDTSPQANLAAFGVASSSGQGFNKSFTEHCLILGLISVRADLNYQQGLARMFSRKTRFDFYWPVFANLGEAPVLNREIFTQGDLVLDGADIVDEQVFGYQERWAEYRYRPSLITGQLRSNFAQSLDTWHLAQDFSSLPLLDATFIQETPPIDRIIAVTSEPEFILDAFFLYKCVRPMPTYSVPGQIDHF